VVDFVVFWWFFLVFKRFLSKNANFLVNWDGFFRLPHFGRSNELYIAFLPEASMSIKQSRRHEVIKKLVRTDGRNAASSRTEGSITQVHHRVG